MDFIIIPKVVQSVGSKKKFMISYHLCVWELYVSSVYYAKLVGGLKII